MSSDYNTYYTGREQSVKKSQILLKTTDQPSKFRIKTWVEVNGDAR